MELGVLIHIEVLRAVGDLLRNPSWPVLAQISLKRTQAFPSRLGYVIAGPRSEVALLLRRHDFVQYLRRMPSGDCTIEGPILADSLVALYLERFNLPAELVEQLLRGRQDR